jgi:hypothetical protein
MTMPNFLIIGAAKAGTTSLHHYLGQHPEIYMSSVKEPSFFAFDAYRAYPEDFGGELERRLVRYSGRPGKTNTIEDYRALFEAVSSERAIGEASPVYLYTPRVPERIQHHVPDARLIVVLRNPVERALSDYVCSRGDRGGQLDNFVQRHREARSNESYRSSFRLYGYVYQGLYHAHLARFLDVFGRDRIKICLHEDFQADNFGMLESVFEFLRVDKTFVPDVSTRYSVTGVPRSEFLRMLPAPLRALGRRVESSLPSGLRRYTFALKKLYHVKPQLPPHIRRECVQVYQEDILQLQKLIERDLSAWLD